MQKTTEGKSMKRTLMIFAAAALASCVLTPAATAKKESPSAKQLASEQCRTEKQEMGNKSFKELYGGKRAMQTCKRQNEGEGEVALSNASQDCRAERDTMGEEAFTAEYGDNNNGRNAFGKCVSGKASDEVEENGEETANAARDCKAERESMGEEAFATEYGTNENRRHAFGKCVSEKAQEDEEEAAPTA
jgi:hypothetical protein